MSDEKVVIIKGDDAQIDVFIKNENLTPYDLSSVTAVKACFIKSDDTSLEITLVGGGVSIEDAAAGHLRITIDDPETLELKEGEVQSFEVQIDESGDKKTVQFLNKLDVLPRVC